MKNYLKMAILGAGLGCGMAVESLANEIVLIEDLDARQTEHQAFRVEEDTQLRIRCIGAVGSEPYEVIAYGWIIDLRTREVVWRLERRNSERSWEINRTFDDEVFFPAGDYSAYYTTNWTGNTREFKIFGKPILRFKRHSKVPAQAREWKLVVETTDSHRAARPLSRTPSFDDPASIVSFGHTGDSSYRTQGFSLRQPTEVQVYCLGEYVDFEDGPVDKGWILDAKTRDRVWEFGIDNFKHGGGAKKNRVSRETILLPAGDYIACYATDDSHSYDAWNDAPPYDPESWGMHLSVENENVLAQVAPFEENRNPSPQYVSLIRQTDGAYVTKGLKLDKEFKLRIHALGEYDFHHHEFTDHGWITSLKDGRVVWEMNHRNTQHAGGARKNRLADEILELPPGDYAVYYATDDSHAYRSWNQEPPYEPELWGIQISLLASEDEANGIRVFNVEERMEKDENILASLVRIRSNEHVTQEFELSEPTRVRIRGLGEGSDGHMYDYGWIEDADSGDWIWEMTYRKSRHAGGAQKNRSFDATILLDRGRYTLNYVTDDSHAWGSWNRPRPNQPHDWGIMVLRTQ